MKLDNSTLENIYRVGLLNKKSFKIQKPYLNDDNSSLWWRISTQNITYNLFLDLEFNGDIGIFTRFLGFWFRKMKSSMCLTLIYLSKIPKIPLINHHAIHLEVRWIYIFTPNLAAACAEKQCLLTTALDRASPHWQAVLGSVYGIWNLSRLPISTKAKSPSTTSIDGESIVPRAVDHSVIWGLLGQPCQQVWGLLQGPLDGPWV